MDRTSTTDSWALIPVCVSALIGCGPLPTPPVKVYCAKSAVNCRCSTTNFTLEQGETATSDCDSVPANSICCFDLDTSGQTASCTCEEFACQQHGSLCDCDFRAAQEAQNGSVSVCDTSQGAICCSGSDGSCACDDRCLETNGTSVTSCPTTPSPTQVQTAACGASSQQASSCKGLKWKAP